MWEFPSAEVQDSRRTHLSSGQAGAPHGLFPNTKLGLDSAAPWAGILSPGSGGDRPVGLIS